MAELSGVTALHAHPNTTGSEMPTPAIWWNQKFGWPPIIRYLFDTQADGVGLADAEDQALYESFIENIKADFLSTLADKAVHEIAFSPILSDVDQLNAWTITGQPWAKGALFVLDQEVSFPPWIIDRERELQSALANGEYPKSRLSNRDDLIG